MIPYAATPDKPYTYFAMRCGVRKVILSFGLFITMTACALPEIRLHPHADYLNEAVGHADHDAIAKKLGAPHRHIALDSGGDLWTYDYCPQGSYLGSAQCQMLNIVFDKSGILADWSDK